STTLRPPPRRRAVAAAPGAAAASAAPAGKWTVLVAEDEDGVRHLASAVLRTRGYKVLTARDGPEALALAQSHAGPIDLLISDVIMPVLSGPDLARSLRAARGGLRVLFISGYGESRLGLVSLNEMSADLLEKPFRPDELAECVARMVGASRPAGAPA